MNVEPKATLIIIHITQGRARVQCIVEGKPIVISEDNVGIMFNLIWNGSDMKNELANFFYKKLDDLGATVADQNKGIPCIPIYTRTNTLQQSRLHPGGPGATYSQGPGNTDWA
jgi:hypothetical protein